MANCFDGEATDITYRYRHSRGRETEAVAMTAMVNMKCVAVRLASRRAGLVGIRRAREALRTKVAIGQGASRINGDTDVVDIGKKRFERGQD